jgi:hypothetical protein
MRYDTCMTSGRGRGRPKKYGRPAHAVTVTLPDDILGHLSTINADIGTAIVHVIERKRRRSVEPVPPAEISRYGKHAVIVVTPVKVLRRLKGVQLVPIGEGRALISLDSTHSVSELELQLRDAVESPRTKGHEREVLELLAEILRGARGERGHTLETRTIIVLAASDELPAREAWLSP